MASVWPQLWPSKYQSSLGVGNHPICPRGIDSAAIAATRPSHLSMGAVAPPPQVHVTDCAPQAWNANSLPDIACDYHPPSIHCIL